MVIINPPLAIYKHLAAFSFMLAGVFSDLLVVRLCLSSAYIFLILNGLLGSPLWPHLWRPGHLTVDMLVWGVVCLYVHLSSVVRLLLDEQHVDLSPQQEALWRMFYRVGGLSRKLFYHHIATHMTVATFQRGDRIPVEEYFYIVYQGTIEIQVHEHGKHLKTDVDGSGSMFDLKSLGLLHTHTPFAGHRLVVTAISDCTFFQFPNKDIRQIANARVTKSVWQTVFIGILARLAAQRLPDHGNQDYAQTHGAPTTNNVDPHYLDPLFAPLSASEVPNALLAGSGKALDRPFAHVWYCMKRFFSPPWPFGRHLTGIRHNMLTAPVPTEGATETLERTIVGSLVKGMDVEDGNSNSSSSHHATEEMPLLHGNQRIVGD